MEYISVEKYKEKLRSYKYHALCKIRREKNNVQYERERLKLFIFNKKSLNMRVLALSFFLVTAVQQSVQQKLNNVFFSCPKKKT